MPEGLSPQEETSWINSFIVTAVKEKVAHMSQEPTTYMNELGR